MPAMETGVNDHVLEFGRSGFPIIPCCPEHCWRCADPVLRKEELSSEYQTGCEDALLVLPGRKRIRSEPSALNQLNNKHNDGNHEQKMNQSAAKVADKAQKPKHH
jgi:hypothetical protein